MAVDTLPSSRVAWPVCGVRLFVGLSHTHTPGASPRSFCLAPEGMQAAWLLRAGQRCGRRHVPCQCSRSQPGSSRSLANPARVVRVECACECRGHSRSTEQRGPPVAEADASHLRSRKRQERDRRAGRGPGAGPLFYLRRITDLPPPPSHAARPRVFWVERRRRPRRPARRPKRASPPARQPTPGLRSPSTAPPRNMAVGSRESPWTWTRRSAVCLSASRERLFLLGHWPPGRTRAHAVLPLSRANVRTHNLEKVISATDGADADDAFASRARPGRGGGRTICFRVSFGLGAFPPAVAATYRCRGGRSGDPQRRPTASGNDGGRGARLDLIADGEHAVAVPPITTRRKRGTAYARLPTRACFVPSPFVPATALGRWSMGGSTTSATSSRADSARATPTEHAREESRRPMGFDLSWQLATCSGPGTPPSRRGPPSLTLYLDVNPAIQSGFVTSRATPGARGGRVPQYDVRSPEWGGLSALPFPQWLVSIIRDVKQPPPWRYVPRARTETEGFADAGGARCPATSRWDGYDQASLNGGRPGLSAPPISRRRSRGRSSSPVSDSSPVAHIPPHAYLCPGPLTSEGHGHESGRGVSKRRIMCLGCLRFPASKGGWSTPTPILTDPTARRSHPLNKQNIRLDTSPFTHPILSPRHPRPETMAIGDSIDALDLGCATDLTDRRPTRLATNMWTKQHRRSPRTPPELPSGRSWCIHGVLHNRGNHPPRMLCRASVLRTLQIPICESDRIPSSVLLRSRLAYGRAPAAPLRPCALRIKFLKAPNLPTDACMGGPLWRTRGGTRSTNKVQRAASTSPRSNTRRRRVRLPRSFRGPAPQYAHVSAWLESWIQKAESDASPAPRERRGATRPPRPRGVRARPCAARDRFLDVLSSLELTVEHPRRPASISHTAWWLVLGPCNVGAVTRGLWVLRRRMLAAVSGDWWCSSIKQPNVALNVTAPAPRYGKLKSVAAVRLYCQRLRPLSLCVSRRYELSDRRRWFDGKAVYVYMDNAVPTRELTPRSYPTFHHLDARLWTKCPNNLARFRGQFWSTVFDVSEGLVESLTHQVLAHEKPPAHPTPLQSPTTNSRETPGVAYTSRDTGRGTRQGFLGRASTASSFPSSTLYGRTRDNVLDVKKYLQAGREHLAVSPSASRDSLVLDLYSTCAGGGARGTATPAPHVGSSTVQLSGVVELEVAEGIRGYGAHCSALLTFRSPKVVGITRKERNPGAAKLARSADRVARPSARNPRGWRSSGLLDGASYGWAAVDADSEPIFVTPSRLALADVASLESAALRTLAGPAQPSRIWCGAQLLSWTGEPSAGAPRRLVGACLVSGVLVWLQSGVGSPLLSRFVCASNPQPMFADLLFPSSHVAGVFSRALQLRYPFVHLGIQCCTHILEDPHPWVVLAFGPHSERTVPGVDFNCHRRDHDRDDGRGLAADSKPDQLPRAREALRMHAQGQALPRGVPPRQLERWFEGSNYYSASCSDSSFLTANCELGSPLSNLWWHAQRNTMRPTHRPLSSVSIGGGSETPPRPRMQKAPSEPPGDTRAPWSAIVGVGFNFVSPNMGVPFSRSYGREGEDQIRADGDSVYLVLGNFLPCKSECKYGRASRNCEEGGMTRWRGRAREPDSASTVVAGCTSQYPQCPTATDSRTVLPNPIAGL
ncbi:hypothetical protein LXA43DRAFT_1145544 [Ganoderma leucocontextum]|nr:hypothetical protein LXA43DRAFT_1145544 [Ganoderma leucocontextum]